jgi:hypothetical protein
MNEHKNNPRETCADICGLPGLNEKVTDKHEQETFGAIDKDHLSRSAYCKYPGACSFPNCSCVPKGDKDPSGLDQHQAGAKLDAGKVLADQILAGFPRALSAIAEVGTFGAKKYSMNGWQSVEDGINRYMNAACRHRLARHKGELYDPESGMLHSWHEAWNVLAALELMERECE